MRNTELEEENKKPGNKYSFGDMMKQIDESNFHCEILTGDEVGEEEGEW